MLLAVEHDYLHVVHRITRERALLHGGFDSFFDRRQIRAGKVHAHEFVGKFKVRVGQRLDPQVDFAELARAARLLFVTVHGRAFARDAFAVRHLRLVGRQPDLELGLGAVQRHVNMLVAHALQDGLTRGFFVVPRERHILLAQTRQRRADLGRVGLRLGMDRDAVQRVRVLRRGQGQRMRLVAERVARRGDGQLRDRADVARVDDLDGNLFLAALEVQSRHALLRAFGLVPHARVRLDQTAVDAEVGHLTDKRVGGRLPNVRGQRTGIGAGQLLLAVPALRGLFGTLRRRGQQVHDGVQERGDADLASARCHEDRNERPGVDDFLQPADQFLV